MYSSPREQVGHAFYLFVIERRQEIGKGDDSDAPQFFDKLVLRATDELHGYNETLKVYYRHGRVQKEFDAPKRPRLVLPQILAKNLDIVREHTDEKIFAKLEEIARAA